MTSRIKKMTINWTTNGSGAATGTGERSILGLLYAVWWNKGSGADGIDLTLATANAAGAQTLLVAANTNASVMYYPRQDSVKTADASAVAANAEMPMLDGIPTVTIAQGGDTKTGSVTLYYFERA